MLPTKLLEPTNSVMLLLEDNLNKGISTYLDTVE